MKDKYINRTEMTQKSFFSKTLHDNFPQDIYTIHNK